MTAVDSILEETRQEEKLKRLAQLKSSKKRVERAEAIKAGATMTGRELKKARRKSSERPTNAHEAILKVRTSEDELRKRYPHVIKGTLGFDEKAHKQTCSIACVDCKTKRDVYTSDLHQVERCRPCTAKKRSEKRRKTRVSEQKATKKVTRGRKSKS